jgi:type II secretion system protein G
MKKSLFACCAVMLLLLVALDGCNRCKRDRDCKSKGIYYVCKDERCIFSEALERSMFATAKIQVCNLKKALNLYRIKKERYPTQKQGLAALVTSRIWARSTIGKDPWGRAFVYAFPAPGNPDGFLVYSLGADGKKSKDDIQCKDR